MLRCEYSQGWSEMVFMDGLKTDVAGGSPAACIDARSHVAAYNQPFICGLTCVKVCSKCWQGI
jgi:hypothetical protein